MLDGQVFEPSTGMLLVLAKDVLVWPLPDSGRMFWHASYQIDPKFLCIQTFSTPMFRSDRRVRGWRYAKFG
jgi:hypothetical protein